MSKRDTDTEIWSEDWFLNLSDAEMLFWNYIKDRCDHAGFWRPNFKIFETITGRRINQKEFIEKVNTEKIRLMVLENGRWFITGFISFQYCGKLNINNRFHKSVYETFRKNIPSENTTTYGFEVSLTSSRPQVEVNKEQKTKNEEQEIKEDLLINEFGTVTFLTPEWVNSFEKYKEISEPEWDRLRSDWEFIAFMKEFHQTALIGTSMEKAWSTYWGTKEGWQNKRKAYQKAKREATREGKPCDYEMDWQLTIQRTLKNSLVYIPYGQADPERQYLEIIERRTERV